MDVSEQAEVIAAASSTLAIQLQSTRISTPNCCGPDPFLCHPARLGTQHSLPRLSLFDEATFFHSSWISALPSEVRTLFSAITPAQKPTNPVVSHLLLWTSLVWESHESSHPFHSCSLIFCLCSRLVLHFSRFSLLSALFVFL